MCRIFIGHGHNKYNNSMEHGGIVKYEKVERGLKLVHHHLPIQSTLDDIPIIDNNRVTILFNGELFDDNVDNDLTLIRDLAELYTDIETFVNYIKDIDGFYSFIVVDKHENSIYAFTDPLGKKQLYYKKDFGIASELRPFENCKINNKVLADINKWGYNYNDETVKEGVFRILPNKIYEFDMCFELLDVGEPFYDFFDPISIKDKTLYDLMDKAVSNRMRGHKRVSMFLSGGLDSSIIHHHVSKHCSIHTICVDNAEDLDYARVVDPYVDAIYLEHDPKALEVMESPIDLGSLYPQYDLFNQAPTVVVLTGDGADEVFGGYKRMNDYDSQLSDVFTEIPFYHNPRLDRMSTWFTKEVRSPFLSLDVVKFGLTLSYEDRINKKYLRDQYEGRIDDRILHRPKEALKIGSVREENQLKYRKGLIDEFTRNFK